MANNSVLRRHGARALLLLATLSLPLLAGAESSIGIPALTATPAAGGGTNYTLPIQTMLLMTALSFIPAALLLMTSFTRIIIVLSLLRQALGTQSSPPNQVMVGLALFLTLFVMGPTFDKIYTEAYLPLQENRISMSVAMDKGAAPLKMFMMKQTRQADLALFVKLSRSPALQGPEDVPLRILVPAFVTSELKTAFQIGFAIFIPFLIIDMVVASVLMSMGMMMMSPAVISLPFKLMLFVLVDGWQLLLGSLAPELLLGVAMTPESVMTLGRHAMEVTLMIAAPMLLVALVIGLIVSIFQAATQINEATLSFIPKLVGIFVALVVAGPWMLATMLDYMREVFNGIPGLVG